MAEQLANNAASTLSSGIDNIVTSLTVANGTVFPASGNFRIVIDSEIIIVGARTGNTLSSLTRGAEGTTAASHSSGAAVTHVVTKGGLDAYLSDALAGAGLISVTVVSATGTYTTPAGATKLIVECVGGGGGGGGTVTTAAAQTAAAGGGGAGGYSQVAIASPSASYSVTIGAAGTGGAAGANAGATGGDTSFGTACVAKGGVGGAAGGVGTAPFAGGGGGAGGAAASGTGDLKSTGAPGDGGLALASTAGNSFGGAGGSSVFGGGAVAKNSAASAGNNAGPYGSGGSGSAIQASTTQQAGGNGSAGVVRVWAFK